MQSAMRRAEVAWGAPVTTEVGVLQQQKSSATGSSDGDKSLNGDGGEHRFWRAEQRHQGRGWRMTEAASAARTCDAAPGTWQLRGGEGGPRCKRELPLLTPRRADEHGGDLQLEPWPVGYPVVQ